MRAVVMPQRCNSNKTQSFNIIKFYKPVYNEWKQLFFSGTDKLGRSPIETMADFIYS